MANSFDYSEEIGLLRRAVAEPVKQLIVVEFDTLSRLNPALEELVALDPNRAHVTLNYDFERDTATGLVRTAREKLKTASGTMPPLLILVGRDDIESTEGAPASQRFWKEMNQAREAWDALGAQILLCVEAWSFRQVMLYADHLLSWAAMKIHLVGSVERPVVVDRTSLSLGLFGDYTLSPTVAKERWIELEQAWAKARESGEPPQGFLQRFFIPMLEAALALGDLVLARKTRDLAHEHGHFPDEDMPRWHELNLALALAGHESNLANEHAYKLLEMAENHPEERVRKRALDAVASQANLLSETAHFELAEPLFRKSLKVAQNSYGSEHPKVASRLSDLAQLFGDTNRLVEAEPLMRRVIEIFEKSLGPEHPDVASAINNLAALLKDTNRLGEAEPLMRRALVIDEKNYGPEHPSVARCLNNLATLLQDTHRLAEAEPLMWRALAIYEKSYGPDHPYVANCLNNLATLLQDTNRLAEAEPLMRRALAIDEKSYGPEHPKVAIRLNNLAQLLQDTHRLAEAEPLMRRGLAIDEKSYGPEHPNVAIRLNNLATLLQDTHRLAEAEPLMQRALAIYEKSYGPKHPSVASCLNNLATLLQDTNRLAEAEPLMQRALAIDEKSYGMEHPRVASCLNNLATLLQNTNRLAEAEPLMRRALSIDEKSYGPEHPKVAIRLNNLAQLLIGTNRLTDAEILIRRHLVIFLKFTRTTGHPHPHLKSAFNNYINLLREMSVAPDRIKQRLAVLGNEAGFNDKAFRHLLKDVFPEKSSK